MMVRLGPYPSMILQLYVVITFIASFYTSCIRRYTTKNDGGVLGATFMIFRRMLGSSRTEPATLHSLLLVARLPCVAVSSFLSWPVSQLVLA